MMEDWRSSVQFSIKSVDLDKKYLWAKTSAHKFSADRFYYPFF